VVASPAPAVLSGPEAVSRRFGAAVRDAGGRRPAPFVGVWERATSTNDLAKAVALDAGAARCAGSVLIAESQTHGKGRCGRTWVSPPGGLYLSVLVEPPPDSLTLLPLAAGVAVARAVRRTSRAPAELRWPNDLDCDGRKVAGVLAEIGFRRDCPQLAVVGFGVNLGPVPLPEVPGDDGAPSAPAPGARPPGWLPAGVDRIALAHALVESLHHVLDLLEEDPTSLRALWESLSPTARECRSEVRLHGGDRVLGTTDGLDDRGGLRVRVAGGGIQVVTASEAVRIFHAEKHLPRAPAHRP
jgi:BirA family biotin operon repressor/biotin-[acetyl-CoA-carboxylase] ligase